MLNLISFKQFRSLGTVSFVDQPQEDEYGRPALRYENTYKMEPTDSFPISKITHILEDVLETLKDKKYDPEKCKTMTKTLSDVCIKIFLI